MKIFNKFSLMLLLVLGLALSPIVRSAQDIDADEIDEDTPINGEDAQTAAETEADEETAEESVTSSPFVRSTFLFIQPESTELPAGKLVKLLVGFQNNGTSSFIVNSIDGSFRYPQDFSYYIQNFSVFEFNKVIEPNKESTFEYLFTPSETFSSRQFGLNINLRYKNLEGKSYVNSVFNETINVVEPDEGIDGETIFLYLFLIAIVVLTLLGLQHFFSIFSKKTRRGTVKQNGSSSAHKSSNGSSANGTGDIDYEWIPREHLTQSKSPKHSPRQRKGVTTASDEQ